MSVVGKMSPLYFLLITRVGPHCLALARLLQEQAKISHTEALELTQLPPILLSSPTEEGNRIWLGKLQRLGVEVEAFEVPEYAWTRVVDAFGSPEKSALWLRRDNRALKGVPLELLGTEREQEVLDVLGRIEYGVVG